MIRESYLIEQEIPMPEKRNTGKSIYPFGEMKVNDSFLIKCRGAEQKVRADSVRAAYSTYRKKFAPEKKFTVRYMKDGVRVWRIL